MDWWFGMIGMTGGLICGIQQLAEWFGMIVYVFSQNPVALPTSRLPTCLNSLLVPAVFSGGSRTPPVFPRREHGIHQFCGLSPSW